MKTDPLEMTPQHWRDHYAKLSNAHNALIHVEKDALKKAWTPKNRGEKLLFTISLILPVLWLPLLILISNRHKKEQKILLKKREEELMAIENAAEQTFKENDLKLCKEFLSRSYDVREELIKYLNIQKCPPANSSNKATWNTEIRSIYNDLYSIRFHDLLESRQKIEVCKQKIELFSYRWNIPCTLKVQLPEISDLPKTLARTN